MTIRFIIYFLSILATVYIHTSIGHAVLPPLSGLLLALIPIELSFNKNLLQTFKSEIEEFSKVDKISKALQKHQSKKPIEAKKLVVCLTKAKELEIQLALTDFYAQFPESEGKNFHSEKLYSRIYFEIIVAIAEGVTREQLQDKLQRFMLEVERLFRTSSEYNKYTPLEKFAKKAFIFNEDDAYYRQVNS